MTEDATALRYFFHVAEASSFVRGAERAHVSPPAVSKAIRKLEHELDVQLFERTTRRVELTAAGHVVFDRCRRVLAELDALGSDLAAAARHPSGPLRIAAMEVFSIELLPLALADLVAAHPDVVPRCSETIPQTMIERLMSGELDLGLTVGATATRGITRHHLGSSPGVIVAGAAHPLYARGRVTDRDLATYPSVVPRFFGAEHLPSLDQFPDDVHPRRVGATIELLQMAVELCVQGAFLGYFPEISVHRHLAAGRLRSLRGLGANAPFELHAIARADVAERPAARVLIDALRRSLDPRRRHRQNDRRVGRNLAARTGA